MTNKNKREKVTTLVVEESHNLPKDVFSKLSMFAEKVIIVKGWKETYDVVKNRYGSLIEDGHIDFIGEEFYNTYG
jgi:hypothetical protein